MSAKVVYGAEAGITAHTPPATLHEGIRELTKEIAVFFEDNKDNSPDIRAAIYCTQPIEGMNPQSAMMWLRWASSVLLKKGKLMISTTVPGYDQGVPMTFYAGDCARHSRANRTPVSACPLLPPLARAHPPSLFPTSSPSSLSLPDLA